MLVGGDSMNFTAKIASKVLRLKNALLFSEFFLMTFFFPRTISIYFAETTVTGDRKGLRSEI